MSDYLILEAFKERFPSISGIDDDDLISAAITAASQAVDAYCGRRFWLDTTTSARWFTATRSHYIDVDDFVSTSSVVVATDDDDDGVAETTWTSDDWFCEPINGKRGGLEGLPFDRIIAANTLSFPTGNVRPSVQVTAQWGWAEVPEAVVQATLIKAAQVYRRKDSPDSVIGGGDFGVIRVSRFEDPTVVLLLGPYRRVGGAGLVAV